MDDEIDDGWECAHCGERKDDSHYDNELVCRECEAIAVAERQFRGVPALDDLNEELEALDD